MALTREEQKAKLQAELAQLDTEDREQEINDRVEETTLPDVIQHLVANSTGYPTHQDREVHARAVHKHYKTGPYAEDEADEAPSEDEDRQGRRAGME